MFRRVGLRAVKLPAQAGQPFYSALGTGALEDLDPAISNSPTSAINRFGRISATGETVDDLYLGMVRTAAR